MNTVSGLRHVSGGNRFCKSSSTSVQDVWKTREVNATLAAVIPLKCSRTLGRIPTESAKWARKAQERLVQTDSQPDNFGWKADREGRFGDRNGAEQELRLLGSGAVAGFGLSGDRFGGRCPEPVRFGEQVQERSTRATQSRGEP